MLQWMDDFSSYGIGGQAYLLNGNYAEYSGSISADPDPSAGGAPVLLTGPNNALDVIGVRRVLPAAQATVGVAARFWLTALPPDTSRRPIFAFFRDVNNVDLVYITVDPTGYLQAYNWNNGAPLLIGQSAAPVIVANAWRHIETKVLCNNGAGTVEVRLEGTPVLNVAGVVTSWNGNLCQNVGPGYLRSVGSIGPGLYVKDLIVWDGSAGQITNFVGSCQVYKILTNADVSLGWTPSSGATGWNLIDREPPPDDADYISAPYPLPAPSTFGLTDLPANVTSVKGVMAVTRSRKTDGGDGQLEVSLLSGASAGAGANRTLTTAYTYWTDMFELDPNGNVAWTKASVNALDMKLDRTV